MRLLRRLFQLHFQLAAVLAAVSIGYPLHACGASWQPAPGTTWYIQLQGAVGADIDVQVYDIDLFDAPQSLIDQLHGLGRKVICYFNAGAFENWRPDAAVFSKRLKGRALEGWPGERWLDIRKLKRLAPIMQARLDMAVAKGCDGVDPDNLDGYQNRSGFPLKPRHQLAYNKALASWAHQRGLSIGLKNDLAQVRQLLSHFDWALNEQCFAYDECDLLAPFIQARKAVFSVEYTGDPAEFCPKAMAAGFSTLLLPLALDGSSRVDCLAPF
jgi:hypothetical protein